MHNKRCKKQKGDVKALALVSDVGSVGFAVTTTSS